MVNMTILICIFIFYGFSFPWTQAEQCALGDPYCLESGMSTCTLTQNCSFCFCDELENDANGFSYICFNSCTHSDLFRAKYVIGNSFRFECYEYEPHYQAIFHLVNLTEIKNIPFQELFAAKYIIQ